MEKKVRTDLTSPPPVPDAEPPVPPVLVDPPVIPERKPEIKTEAKREQPRQRRRERRSMMPAILAGVAVVAVLLCGYRFVHFWSEPTCQQKARCSICGLEKDGYASHDWTDGSCTEAGTCTVCGAVEDRAPGHRWQDGVCTVCGAEQTNEVLRWEPFEGHDVEYEWLPEEHAIVLSDSSLKNFSQMDIFFRDYRDDTVSTDRYTVERSDETVKVNLPRDLEPGRYVIHAGVQKARVLQFHYGTGGIWLPEDADGWLEDFKVFNAAHGHYLARFQEDVPLRGVPTAEEATRFVNPWRMCGVKKTADGMALTDGNDIKFEMDHYLRIDEGAQGSACVFHIENDNWYLTMNADGQVSLTDTLDEGCFWIVDSGLQ